MGTNNNKEMVLIQWDNAKFSPSTYNEKANQELGMALFKSASYVIARENTTTIIAAEQNDQEEYRDITLTPVGQLYLSVG